MAMGLAFVYWLARIGFDNPVGPPMKAAALALFMINVPYVLHRALARRGTTHPWPASYSFIWIVTATLVISLGRLVPLTGLNPFPFLAGAGGIAFLVALAGYWRSNSLLPTPSYAPLLRREQQRAADGATRWLRTRAKTWAGEAR